MTYSPLVSLHILGGVLGFLSGTVALAARKGGRVHRVSGQVFVASMLGMAAAGAFVALTKAQWSNVVAGSFTLYLVATAWLTVRRKARTSGGAERALALLGFLVAAGAFGLGATQAKEK